MHLVRYSAFRGCHRPQWQPDTLGLTAHVILCTPVVHHAFVLLRRTNYPQPDFSI